MANTFEHIYIFNTIPVQESTESGKEYKLYSCIQTWPSNQELPENYAWVSKESFTEFYNTSKAIDTTASGDVFNGGFLYALTTGRTPADSAKFAAVVSGLQTQNYGAIQAIPYKDAVLEKIS